MDASRRVHVATLARSPKAMLDKQGQDLRTAEDNLTRIKGHKDRMDVQLRDCQGQARAATEVIRNTWRITDKPTVRFGSGLSAEYLSVDICAAPDGWYLSQAVHC